MSLTAGFIPQPALQNYDPMVGRFMSEDTIGFNSGDANLYRYVSNSPVNFNDPNGTDLYDVVNKIDQVVGGFASGATGGATDIIREKIYGGSVNDNQHGIAHDIANVAGDVASDFVPGGKGGKLVRAGRGFLDNARKASDLYRKGQSLDRILKGCGTLDDLEELAGGLGNGSKKRGGGNNGHPPVSRWTPPANEGHHTIPKEIQKKLPPDVAKSKDVKGRRGNPNIKKIPYDKHREIHEGAGGGTYNRRFEEEIQNRGGYGNVDPKDINEIRDDLIKEFNL